MVTSSTNSDRCRGEAFRLRSALSLRSPQWVVEEPPGMLRSYARYEHERFRCNLSTAQAEVCILTMIRVNESLCWVWIVIAA